MDRLDLEGLIDGRRNGPGALRRRGSCAPRVEIAPAAILSDDAVVQYPKPLVLLSCRWLNLIPCRFPLGTMDPPFGTDACSVASLGPVSCETRDGAENALLNDISQPSRRTPGGCDTMRRSRGTVRRCIEKDGFAARTSHFKVYARLTVDSHRSARPGDCQLPGGGADFSSGRTKNPLAVASPKTYPQPPRRLENPLFSGAFRNCKIFITKRLTPRPSRSYKHNH